MGKWFRKLSVEFEFKWQAGRTYKKMNFCFSDIIYFVAPQLNNLTGTETAEQCQNIGNIQINQEQ